MRFAMRIEGTKIMRVMGILGLRGGEGATLVAAGIRVEVPSVFLGRLLRAFYRKLVQRLRIERSGGASGIRTRATQRVLRHASTCHSVPKLDSETRSPPDAGPENRMKG